MTTRRGTPRTAPLAAGAALLAVVGLASSASAAPADQPAAAPVPARAMYRYVAIPVLGSGVFGAYNSAAAVDTAGHVIGSSSMDDSGSHAYSWRAGKLTDLGALRSGPLTESEGLGVSEGGVVVGASQVDGPGDTGQHAYRIRSGTMVDLGTGYADHRSGSAARAADDAGKIVGVHYETQPSPERAVIWRHGKLAELPDLGGEAGAYGTISAANAVNNHGRVVGVAQPRDSAQAVHGVLWKKGTLTDLGNLGGTSNDTTAYDINDSGVVVGRSDIGTITHAFSWHHGVMRDLGALGEDGKAQFSEAFGINNAGTVVGDTVVTDAAGNGLLHATIWRNGVATDLNDLVTGLPDGARLETARAVNNDGIVVGEVCSEPNQCNHDTAYELVPLW